MKGPRTHGGEIEEEISINGVWFFPVMYPVNVDLIYFSPH